MSEYMTLLGAEDVSRAASSMREAATQMQSAASNLDDTLYRHRLFLDDWLMRFEEMLERRINIESKNS